MTKVNTYCVFLCHLPNKHFHLKYQNDILKRNPFGICSKCEWWFFMSCSYCLIFYIGKSPIADGDLLGIKFNPQKILGVVLRDEDVNIIPHLIHVTCMTISMFKQLITPSSFDSSIFFHPNIHTDGWDEKVGIYERVHSAYRKEKLKVGVSEDLPDFLLVPRFWINDHASSDYFSWPPHFFSDWSEIVKCDGCLALDPAPLSVSGPSNPAIPLPTQFYHF